MEVQVLLASFFPLYLSYSLDTVLNCCKYKIWIFYICWLLKRQWDRRKWDAGKTCTFDTQNIYCALDPKEQRQSGIMGLFLKSFSPGFWISFWLIRGWLFHSVFLFLWAFRPMIPKKINMKKKSLFLLQIFFPFTVWFTCIFVKKKVLVTFIWNQWYFSW